MAISGKLFPGQGEEEKIIFVVRKHWFSYMIFIFFGAIMLVPVVAGIIYWIVNPTALSQLFGNISILFASAYLLFVMAVLIAGIVDYYLDIYIVTNERIVLINQEGLFRRQISELHLHQIQDVNAKVEGIFQTIFHFGNVTIQTAAEKENFAFMVVPHPYRIAKTILDLHEHHIDEHVNKEVEELERAGEGSQNTGSRAEKEINKLVKEPEAKKVITDQEGKVSRKEQQMMEENIKKDFVMLEKEHYLVPPKSGKKKEGKKSGEMKPGKEIDLDEIK